MTLSNRFNFRPTWRVVRRTFVRLGRAEGSALFEFLMVFPLLSVFLVGIIYGGITFYDYEELANAVAVGARTLANNRGAGAGPPTACSLEETALRGAAANLSPRAAHDLATYFSMLSPKVANDGDKQLAATGQALYEHGNPDSNTVSCAVCHGPNAEGIRDIPRLGGLSYYYLKRKLKQWGEGYHVAAKSPMPLVASKLSPNQIEELASYLSFVK